MDKQTIFECMKKLCAGCRAGFPLEGKMHLEKEEKWTVKTVCKALPLYSLLDEDDVDVKKVILESLYKTQSGIKSMTVTGMAVTGVRDTEKSVQQMIDWLEGIAETPVVGLKVPEVVIGCTPGRCG